MRLDEIKQYKTNLPDDEAVWKMLNKHCKDSLGKLPLVRGMNPFDANYGIIHGSAGGRKSANTSNHYTVILDAVLPKEFPKRGASIICGNWANRRYASTYGVAYAIIPFDGVKIGVCPGRDIFDTEISLSKHQRARDMPINRWNDWYNDRQISDESFPALIRDFKRYLGNHDFWDLEPETIRETIAKAYATPFKLATTADDGAYNDGEEHELWIGGKCVAIDMLWYRRIMKQGRSPQMSLKF